jgi:hypothetical protein
MVFPGRKPQIGPRPMSVEFFNAMFDPNGAPAAPPGGEG